MLKLDAVTSGSDATDTALDSRGDVAASPSAPVRNGRPIRLAVSWHVDHGQADLCPNHARA